MPDSWTGNDHFFIEDVKKYTPMTALDVGVGHGKVGRLLFETMEGKCHIEGIEVYPPYLAQKVLYVYYKRIHEMDVVDWMQQNVDWQKDLVVFGDVLEHLTYSNAISILHQTMYRAKLVAVFTPMAYLQNSLEGNKHEAHRCSLKLQDFASFNVLHYVNEPMGTLGLQYVLMKGFV